MTSPRPSLLQALHAAHVRLGVTAVIAGGVVLALLSFLTLRTHVEQNLNLVARSIAYTAEAAAVFGDPAAADEIVATIAAHEGLLAAEIVTPRDGVLARFERERGTTAEAGVVRLGSVLFPLRTSAPLMSQGRQIGVVDVRGDGRVYLLFLLQAVAALGLCLAAIGAWVARLTRRVERDFVAPLNQLATLTRLARTRRELSLRAPGSAVQEIHALGEDVNALLAEIQSREAEMLARHDDLQSANASLSRLAYHDSLTGLPNRASFLQHAAQAVMQGHGSGTRFAVLFVDCDHFKSINDRLGHAAGDEVLIATARRLRSRVREGDLVARLGGDEFAVLLMPISGRVEAARRAADIAELLAEPVRSEDHGLVPSSASVGVAVFPTHGATVESLLAAADAAMYDAKTQARGSSRLFGADHDGRTDTVPG